MSEAEDRGGKEPRGHEQEPGESRGQSETYVRGSGFGSQSNRNIMHFSISARKTKITILLPGGMNIYISLQAKGGKYPGCHKNRAEENRCHEQGTDECSSQKQGWEEGKVPEAGQSGEHVQHFMSGQ